MAHESSGAMPPLSSDQDARTGQRRAWALTERWLATGTPRGRINIKLPTGYGKTKTYCGIYRILQSARRATRLLVIFPADGQLLQFERDCVKELRALGVTGELTMTDLRLIATTTILRRHRTGSHQIYATTVQALLQGSTRSLVQELMASEAWMIVVDEYHHYGIDRAWGRAVLALPSVYVVACSATPHRPHDDSAFGPPDVEMTFRDAQEEGAVKRLVAHSYVYRLDAVNGDGEVRSYTTDDLASEAGSDSPDAIEELTIKRKMRWSPKYLSPLICTPIDRMRQARISYGGLRLQVLIGAMCVSHAQLVCDQVRNAYPDLRVEWVGTGTYGRPGVENKQIMDAFCPEKDDAGERHPTIDVLVHFGMAGEGLDCQAVIEYVFVCPASLTNRSVQAMGRAARSLVHAPNLPGHINFDSTSPYAAEYLGEKIMDAMDFRPPQETEPTPEEPQWPDEGEIPSTPDIRVYNVALLRIDRGDPGVERMVRALGDVEGRRIDIDDPEDWAKVEAAYRKYRDLEAQEMNERSKIHQWSDQVENALAILVGTVIRRLINPGERFDRTLLGDIKKRLNARKLMIHGPKVNDLEVLKRHYQWCYQTNTDIRHNGLPEWLR